MNLGHLKNLKSSALQLATNLRGWKTKRKLVIFESDDWGAIRMPSKTAHRALSKAGIPVDRWRYDSLDCLEQRSDLENLFDLLNEFQDINGNPARFTFNFVMGNPDFQKIRDNGFSHFAHQHFYDSYEQYYGDSLQPLWKEAMAQNVAIPQFHAREHLNSLLWMRDLRSGLAATRLAFDHGYYGMITQTSSLNQKSYLAAYWPENEDDLAQLKVIIQDGMQQFQQTFGYQSRTFIACNYVFPDDLEPVLADQGVSLIQGQRGNLRPDRESNWGLKIDRRHTGQRNTLNQTYSVRNVMFEPFNGRTQDPVAQALLQIAQAFRIGTPAIISTHRINYVSEMSVTHRDKNLDELRRLLSSMKDKWVDIEFITSSELAVEI